MKTYNVRTKQWRKHYRIIQRHNFKNGHFPVSVPASFGFFRHFERMPEEHVWLPIWHV